MTVMPPIRDQWDSKTGAGFNNCTAQALAAIIDMQRTIASIAAPKSRTPRRGESRKLSADESASAGMIFFRGHEVEAAEQGIQFNQDEDYATGLRSLRSALKGFFHNGACSQGTWRERAKEVGGPDSVKIGKEARRTPLGAYYRLQPILNDYHAALNEVGAIYAAAEIHTGWGQAEVRRNGGIIEPPADSSSGSMNHAFVIVGYNQEGFLVLNSWGAKWGGYPADDAGKRKPMAGIALWRYRDWAERTIDGWVLRLGVTAPEAFRYSFVPQGLTGFLSGEISYVSTPRHELVGHYAHLDDGQLVLTGTLPSTPDSIRATRELIERRFSGQARGVAGRGLQPTKYSDVLVWLAGGNEPTKEASHQIAATKDFWKSKGIYPLTVLWCSDFIESALDMLAKAFDAAEAKVGKPGPSLDARVETEARGVGRAFWRDIKASARKAASEKTRLGDEEGPGGMYALFEELVKLDSGIRLHFVAEGAGAILLAELLMTIGSARSRRIETITLNMPSCTVKVFEDVYVRWSTENNRHIDILVPKEAAEKRMRVGSYGGSLLKLVQMSFEEDTPRRQRSDGTEPKTDREAPASSLILGLQKVAGNIALSHRGKVSAIELDGPDGEDPIRSMRDITMGRRAQEHIHKLILGRPLRDSQPVPRRMTPADTEEEK